MVSDEITRILPHVSPINERTLCWPLAWRLSLCTHSSGLSRGKHSDHAFSVVPSNVFVAAINAKSPSTNLAPRFNPKANLVAPPEMGTIGTQPCSVS